MSERMKLCRSYLSRPLRRRTFAATGFAGYRRKHSPKIICIQLQTGFFRVDAGLKIADNPADVVLHNSVNSADPYEFLELKRLQIA
jgi:hypothetical protein